MLCDERSGGRFVNGFEMGLFGLFGSVSGERTLLGLRP